MATSNIKGLLFAIVILLTTNTLLFAQSWNLPDNRPNTRLDITDNFNIPRPALSMRGFDNSASDSYSNQYSLTTYGVRQILEKAFPINQNIVLSVGSVFKGIITNSKKSFLSFTSDDNRDINSRILEARAFAALMSFIIKKNSSIFNDLSDPYDMPSHTEAMNSLRSALLVSDKSRYFRKNVSSTSPFKRGTTFSWILILSVMRV